MMQWARCGPDISDRYAPGCFGCHALDELPRESEHDMGATSVSLKMRTVGRGGFHIAPGGETALTIEVDASMSPQRREPRRDGTVAGTGVLTA